MRWLWRSRIGIVNSNLMLEALLLVLLLLHSRSAVIGEAVEAKESASGDECRSPEATASCGQCIKQGPECAWCADPVSLSRISAFRAFTFYLSIANTPFGALKRLNSSYHRCDSKSVFPEVCAPQYLLSPSTEIKVAPQHVSSHVRTSSIPKPTDGSTVAFYLQNLPLGTRRADSITPIQLEPQQVEIRMKPGVNCALTLNLAAEL